MICKTKDCLDNIGDNNSDIKTGCGAWGDSVNNCKDYTTDEQSEVRFEAKVVQKAYGQDVKRVIEIYLDNAQSQPKISVIDNGNVDCNLPISNSILNEIFPETDRILLQRLLIKPYKEGYKIEADM